jgi:hypothetical protein
MPDPAANLPPSDEPPARLPEAMQRDLRALYGPVAGEWADAAAMDDAVLAQARAHFDRQDITSRAKPSPAGRGRSLNTTTRAEVGAAGPRLARWGVWLHRRRIPLAAAAALLLAMTVALVVLNSSNPDSPPMAAAPPMPGDVNGDGKLDILDAYLLARRLKQSGQLDAQWDITRDGQVDDDDVNALTAQAVRLRSTTTGVGS